MTADLRDPSATGSVAAGARGQGDQRDTTVTERARQLIVGRPRPTVGAGPAAKAVAEDASRLVRAELELAKAELSAAVKSKATGAGMLVGVAVLVWLGVQGLLITAGLALALVLPGWAAALIVTAVLLIVAGVLALLARRKLRARVSLDTTKHNIEEDVAWTKAHMPSR